MLLGPVTTPLDEPPHAADPVAAQLESARATSHHGPSARRHRDGTALCLSGGGYRAALFHLGAVRRLDELGVLGRLRTISAVSGGAVVANLLTDPRLEWPGPHRPPGRVAGLEELVAGPLRRLTSRNVRTPALLSRLRPSGWARGDASVRVLAEELERAVPWWATDLREHTRGGPVVLTGATEIGYGVPWVFADARSAGPRGRVGDHRLGHAAPPPGLRIVDAVAATCAYPPFFAPLELDGSELGLRGGVPDPGEPVAVRAALHRRIQLADGGVYDNLAVEPVWADHDVVLVSDGGAVGQGRPAGSVLGRWWQVLSIASGGGQSTRLRWLRAAYAAGTLRGATWSLGSPAAPAHPADLTTAINRVRTDLDAFTPGEQMVLERHGYLVADAAVRRHCPEVVALGAPVAPPHPQVAVPAAATSALSRSARVTALGRR